MSRTTSRGVVWEVIAPVVTGPLRSYKRLLSVVGAGVLAIVLSGALSGGEKPAKEEQAEAASSESTSGSIFTGPTTSSASPTATPSAAPSSEASPAPVTPSADNGATFETPQLSAKQRKAGAPYVKKADRLAHRLVKYRGTKTFKAWWKVIGEDVSPQGRSQLKELGPRGLPFTKITGKPALVVTEADNLPGFTSVGVPTDKGTYLFLLDKKGVASISELMPQAEADAEMGVEG